jgi:hypothetical protein
MGLEDRIQVEAMALLRRIKRAKLVIQLTNQGADVRVRR